MTELPEELKKAEFWGVYYEMEPHRRVEGTVIPSSVVASFLERKREGSCSAEMLVSWLKDEERKPSGIAFTDGNERRVAWWIENMVKTVLEKKRKELVFK